MTKVFLIIIDGKFLEDEKNEKDWYHSHTGLQEQIGMYGAFIINKRKEWDIPTLPIVLSEWTGHLTTSEASIPHLPIY